jgi:hypothetical protein
VVGKLALCHLRAICQRSQALPDVNAPLPIYGTPIPDELFYPILNAGIYHLLSGDNASASMLFYWAFTTQKSSTLAVTYSLIIKELGYSKPRISRTLDRIRESSLFTIKTTMKGVFIDINTLIEEVKKAELQSVQSSGNESLPLSSSSFFKDYNTTTYRSNDTLLLLKNINPTEFRILVDLIIFYGYTSKDISPKLIDVMADCYKNKNIEYIAYNLAYAAKNKKKVGSPTGYLLKTLTEDYGSTSLPYEDRAKSQRLIEAFRVIRNGTLEDCGTVELTVVPRDFSTNIIIQHHKKFNKVTIIMVS